MNFLFLRIFVYCLFGAFFATTLVSRSSGYDDHFLNKTAKSHYKIFQLKVMKSAHSSIKDNFCIDRNWKEKSGSVHETQSHARFTKLRVMLASKFEPQPRKLLPKTSFHKGRICLGDKLTQCCARTFPPGDYGTSNEFQNCPNLKK